MGSKSRPLSGLQKQVLGLFREALRGRKNEGPSCAGKPCSMRCKLRVWGKLELLVESCRVFSLARRVCLHLLVWL